MPSYLTAFTYVITTTGLILILYFYFWYRNRVIKRNEYAAKVWPFSLRAGFFAYIFSILLIGATAFIGAIQEGSYAEAFIAELRSKISKLNQQEMDIAESLVSDVETEADVAQKLRTIDEYLALINRKSALGAEYVNFCQKLCERRDDKRTLEKVNQLRVLANKNIDLARKCLLTLKDFYETGDENFWYAHKQISVEQQAVEMQYKEIVRQLSDML